MEEKQEWLCTRRQMDKFLTCLAIDQIADGGAAVNTEISWTLLQNDLNF